jgi:hypothetical protein
MAHGGSYIQKNTNPCPDTEDRGGVRGIFFGGPAGRFIGPVTLRPRVAPCLLLWEIFFFTASESPLLVSPIYMLLDDQVLQGQIPFANCQAPVQGGKPAIS